MHLVAERSGLVGAGALISAIIGSHPFLAMRWSRMREGIGIEVSAADRHRAKLGLDTGAPASKARLAGPDPAQSRSRASVRCGRSAR
jgi:hypothetical protein